MLDFIRRKLTRSKIEQVLLFSGLLYIATSLHNGEVIFSRWVLLFWGLSGLASFYLGKRYHWSVGLFVFYTLACQVWVFGWRDNHFANAPWLDRLMFGKLSAEACAHVLLFILALVLAPRPTIKYLERAFVWVALLDSYYVILQFCLGHTPYGGFMGNPSMNGTFIVLLAPLIWKWVSEKKTWAFYFFGVLPVFGMLLSRASVPLITFIIISVVYGYRLIWTRLGMRYFMSLTGVLASVFISGVFLLRHGLTNSSGRYKVWFHTMRWWEDHANFWFGAGASTAGIYLPYVQQKDSIIDEGHFFVFFHNDWLQILFEQGIIGLILAALVFCFMLYFTHRRIALFCSVLAYGVSMLANFPLHHSLHAFFGVLLVAMTYVSKPAKINV